MVPVYDINQGPPSFYPHPCVYAHTHSTTSNVEHVLGIDVQNKTWSLFIRSLQVS